MSEDTQKRRLTQYLAGGALVVAGMLGGAVLAGSMTANAAVTDTGSTTVVATDQTGNGSNPVGSGGPSGSFDPSQPMRADEQLLTGDKATQVTDVTMAKYPNATIQRVETDSDGVYEAHIVTADGQQLIVQVGKDFTITGTDTMGAPG